MKVSGWVYLAPFFLSAVFFLSRLFILFSPLPILFLFMQKGRKWAWLSVLSNGLIVAVLGGLAGFALYMVFVGILAAILPELLIRKQSIEKSVGVTLLAMGLFGMMVLFGYAQIEHVDLVNEIHVYIGSMVDTLAKSLLSNSALVDSAELEEWKHNIMLEFPSAIAIFSLILIWINFVILFKLNPNKTRERFQLDLNLLKKWKAPDYFIWPTIASGFFLLINFGTVSDISLNVFKFLMTIYAIQGLSIFCYFFDAWGLKGIIRLLGYGLPLVFMTPLVLSVGFFDLWFDFRNKFRQS